MTPETLALLAEAEEIIANIKAADELTPAEKWEQIQYVIQDVGYQLEILHQPHP